MEDIKPPIPLSYKEIAHTIYDALPYLKYPLLYLNPFYYWGKIVNRGYIFFAPRGRRKKNFWRSHASKYNSMRMMDVEYEQKTRAYYRDSYMFYWIMHARSRLKGIKDRIKCNKLSSPPFCIFFCLRFTFI